MVETPRNRRNTENQTNHVVVTGINRHVTVTQYHLLRNNGCRKQQRHNDNHGSPRIKHLFLVSRKIISQNHASRLLWKSRFTRKKLAISHFTEKKKGPITSHENTLYHPLEKANQAS